MSRSRRKLDTSPIEYDEVVESPVLKGMVSFLEVPPGALPQLDFTVPTETGIPPSPVPIEATPVRDVPVPDVPELGIPSPAVPEAPLPPIPEKGIPDPRVPLPASAFPPVLPRPITRVRRATLAQDGHSFGEQALYEALWQHAHPHDTDTRIITIGYRRMAELSRLTVNNSKANIQSLIQKLAVQEVASFTHSQGRTYLVYSYAAIIQRRREAGLTHYIKSRGVAFVDPDTGDLLTTRLRDKTGIPFSSAPNPAAVPEGDIKGAPKSSVSGTPDSTPSPYSQLARNISATASTSTSPKQPVPPELIQGLRQVVDFLDDEAAAVLWHQCRRRAADCTPEEVLHFTRGKAAIFTTGKIQNPTGFLLAVVPKCFEGASFLEYRQEQARLRQLETDRVRDAEEQIRQIRREFAAILEDPNSSEEDRRFVRRMLEGN